MKRFAPLFLVLLIICTIAYFVFDTEPKIVDGSKVTAFAVVTDRAMSDNMAYLSVEFPDGNALCLWDHRCDLIPDNISIGDTVEVTYGRQDGFDRYILITVKKDTAFAQCPSSAFTISRSQPRVCPSGKQR